MAGSPQYKIFRNGEYVASAKEPADAAKIIWAGVGDTCKYNHRVVVLTSDDFRIDGGTLVGDMPALIRSRIVADAKKRLGPERYAQLMAERAI